MMWCRRDSVRVRAFPTTAIALVSLMAGLAACGSSSPSSSPGAGSGKSPIVVGNEVPLTGTAAADGRQEEQGWNLALQVFGDSVDGHKIVTDFENTQGNPAVALSSARFLVENKHVNIVEGPLLANEISAVASYLGPLGVPLDNLDICAGSQLKEDAQYGNAFSSGWVCNTPDIIAADYLYKDLGYRQVTVLANDYAFGWLSAGGFIKQFTTLGGKIDKVLWPPLSTVDYSSYVSAVPPTTQAVFAEDVGAGSVAFTKAYAQYGLRGKIPLYGNTTLFDYSVLPSEAPATVLGDEMVAQYCDGIDNPVNNSFTNRFEAAYHSRPGYYAEADYVKAALVVAAMKKLNGVATDKAAVAKVLKSTPIQAPRGPVTLSTKVEGPVQNAYVCKVENVKGQLEDVPVKTIVNVQPWATLGYQAWKAEFDADSTARPRA